jgi:hypothetical protein
MLAQVSVEFISAIAFLLVLLFFVVYQNYQTSVQLEEMKLYKEAYETVNKIALEINLALKSGDGYSRKFYVTDKLYGVSNFSVEVKDYTVRLVWSKGSVSSGIMTRNITGIIKPGENTIKNVKGDVFVE